MGVATKDDSAEERKSGPPSKVVFRRLPPSMTEVELVEQLSPLPPYDYLKFTPADMSLSPWAYSRAYINVTNVDDILLLRDRFNGYVFVDQKGTEYPCMVEFAPSQKVPSKKPKKDPKCGTIDEDPEYKEFLELLKNPKHPELQSIETTLTEIEKREKELKDVRAMMKQKTPLVEFLEWKKEERIKRLQEKRRQREEEKMRRDEERRKRLEREKREAAQRKQREKESAAKKLAAKPERAPRFEKKHYEEENWDTNEGPDSKGFHEPGASKNVGKNRKYEDDFGEKKVKKDEHDYDYKGVDSSYAKKPYPPKKSTVAVDSGHETGTWKPKGRGQPKWRGGDDGYYEDTRKDVSGEDEKKQRNTASAAGSKDKNKSRYKDKPSVQLYQPGKNRKLVESQEKPLVFKDADES